MPTQPKRSVNHFKCYTAPSPFERRSRRIPMGNRLYRPSQCGRRCGENHPRTYRVSHHICKQLRAHLTITSLNPFANYAGERVDHHVHSWPGPKAESFNERRNLKMNSWEKDFASISPHHFIFTSMLPSCIKLGSVRWAENRHRRQLRKELFQLVHGHGQCCLINSFHAEHRTKVVAGC